jgi:hypothetical protein
MTVKYSKWPYVKYTSIFHSKALHNLPKLGFLVWKQTIWQRWCGSVALHQVGACAITRRFYNFLISLSTNKEIELEAYLERNCFLSFISPVKNCPQGCFSLSGCVHMRALKECQARHCSWSQSYARRIYNYNTGVVVG